MSPAELVEAMLQASAELQSSLAEHDRCVRVAAAADRDRALAEAVAYLAASGTVDARKAYMTKATLNERYADKLAEGLERSALEAIRSRRQVLSALQSIGKAIVEEAGLARYEGAA